MLEEMEKEFGISCPSGLTKEQYQDEKLDQDKHDSVSRGSLQSHQEELDRAQSAVSQMEEEKNKVGITAPAWVSPSWVIYHKQNN